MPIKELPPLVSKIDFLDKIGSTFQIVIADDNKHKRLCYQFIRIRRIKDDFFELDSFCADRKPHECLISYSDIGLVLLGHDMFPEWLEPDTSGEGIVLTGKIVKIIDISNHLQNFDFLPFLS